MGGKTRNIAIQLVLQHCGVTSCMFFVARYSVALLSTSLTQPAGILGRGPSKASVSRELQEGSLWGTVYISEG